MIPFPMSSESPAFRAELDGVRGSAIRGDLGVGRYGGWRREAAHDGDRCVDTGESRLKREDAVCEGVAQDRLNLEEQVHAVGQPKV